MTPEDIKTYALNAMDALENISVDYVVTERDHYRMQMLHLLAVAMIAESLQQVSELLREENGQ
jgi:hypothetical protein